ncbi:belongs to the protein kinase super [Ancistrocladus abbreviatus]
MSSAPTDSPPPRAASAPTNPPPPPPAAPPPTNPSPPPPAAPPPTNPSPPPSASPAPTNPPPPPPPPPSPTNSSPPSPAAQAPISPSPPPPQAVPRTNSTPPPTAVPTPSTPLKPTPSNVLTPPPSPGSSSSPALGQNDGSKFLPPPPPAVSSHLKHSTPSSSSSSSPSFSASHVVVVGAAVGGVLILFVLGLVILCCCYCRKKKTRDNHGAENYYPAPGTKGGHHVGQVKEWQQYDPQSAEYHLMSKPSTTSRSYTPPPPLSSSGSSRSNYSGPQNCLPPPSRGLEMSFSKSMFTYEELAMATAGFSEDNLLGQGGFGYVHKGVLPNGKELAVKSLKAGSGQGEREFQAEVEIISRVHHRHLVSLVGYCIAGSQRMLVYEFVPNNTLQFHLYGKGQPTMDWPTRLKVALGSAKGLAYLHEDCHPKIIHRDIKAANILLDLNFEAKVADFGLAKFSSDANTHVSTRVMGTFGYLAPEYASSGKLTEKSDVFSFGVMLLELITGRKPYDPTHSEDSLVDWAGPELARALEDEYFDPIVDPRLQKSYDRDEMARMVACAAVSVSHSARHRPRMSQIVRALEGNMSLSELNERSKPSQSTVHSAYESSEYGRTQHAEDMKRFKKMVFDSHEYASSEYSVTTSKYGS